MHSSVTTNRPPPSRKCIKAIIVNIALANQVEGRVDVRWDAFPAAQYLICYGTTSFEAVKIVVTFVAASTAAEVPSRYRTSGYDTVILAGTTTSIRLHSIVFWGREATTTSRRTQSHAIGTNIRLLYQSRHNLIKDKIHMRSAWHGPVTLIFFIVWKPSHFICTDFPAERCSIDLNRLVIPLLICRMHHIHSKVKLFPISRHIKRVNHLHSATFTN
mmetsp:Transcript_11970/g.19960  ORF Transcript_11970/g.19960 Transcript_11970/m.19960 type:complete len:216 (+) Transcript_11970:35-682(+)